jgi:hypothetical protein
VASELEKSCPRLPYVEDADEVIIRRESGKKMGVMG